MTPRIWTVLCPWVGVRRLPQHFAQSFQDSFPSDKCVKSSICGRDLRFATGIRCLQTWTPIKNGPSLRTDVPDNRRFREAQCGNAAMPETKGVVGGSRSDLSGLPKITPKALTELGKHPGKSHCQLWFFNPMSKVLTARKKAVQYSSLYLPHKFWLWDLHTLICFFALGEAERFVI